MIKMILFDLDGTLLPMDQEIFTKKYFKRLAAKLAPYGYEPQKLIDSIWAGTAAMVKNDGSCTNEEAFWKFFSKAYGAQVIEDKPLFEEYYRVEFQEVAKDCGFNPKAGETVKALKSSFRVALATNPLFPDVATRSRIRWAGLEPEDFETYTTYENCHYCKPNPDYYRELLKWLDCKPEECLMVGNDVEEDLSIRRLGVSTYLVTDTMEDRKGQPFESEYTGSLKDLLLFIQNL